MSIICCLRPIYNLKGMTSLPDFSKVVRPGDIILVWSRRPMKDPICIAQKYFGYPRQSFHICHVAMCIDQHILVHSMPRSADNLSDGVRYETIEDACRDRAISIVRVPELSDDNTLSKRIVEEADRHIGGQYAHSKIMTLAVAAFHRLLQRGKGDQSINGFGNYINDENLLDGEPDPRLAGFICSDFIFYLFEQVLREKNPFNHPDYRLAPTPVPAQFFLNPLLENIELPPITSQTS